MKVVCCVWCDNRYAPCELERTTCSFCGRSGVYTYDAPDTDLPNNGDEQEYDEDRFERTIIITRHRGLIEWLRRHGIEASRVTEHATAEDVRGRIVYGVLPLSLAAEAAEVWTVDMPSLRPDQRGVDLTPEEMDAAGATLSGYRVTRIQGRQ